MYICAIPRELDAQIALHAAANFSGSKNYLPRKQKEARKPRKTLRINISIGVEKRKGKKAIGARERLIIAPKYSRNNPCLSRPMLVALLFVLKLILDCA